jgi:hypothetical protein
MIQPIQPHPEIKLNQSHRFHSFSSSGFSVPRGMERSLYAHGVPNTMLY